MLPPARWPIRRRNPYNDQMRRRTLLRGLMVVSLSLASGCAARDTSLAEVRQRGRLRVGLDAAFPPFEAIEADGSIVGLDADLAASAASALGVRPEWHNISFDGLYDALAARQVDMLASALTVDPLRTRDVAYSRPYFEDGIVVIGRTGVSPPADVAQLAGRLAVEMGSESATVARRSAKLAEVAELMSESEVMQAVAAGKVDWGLTDKVSACALRQSGGAISVGSPQTRLPYCLATRASDTSLASALNAALEDILVSPAWQASKRRWLGEDC
jgi:polar amino acid transport system substrate-binding protein